MNLWPSKQLLIKSRPMRHDVISRIDEEEKGGGGCKTTSMFTEFVPVYKSILHNPNSMFLTSFKCRHTFQVKFECFILAESTLTLSKSLYLSLSPSLSRSPSLPLSLCLPLRLPLCVFG